MFWIYSQWFGCLWNPEGKLIAKDLYSGYGLGVNAWQLEHIPDVGPVPRGDWEIGEPIDSENTGPHVLPLTPVGHDAHGRTVFQIHGDNRHQNQTASEGCIIAPRFIREKIAKSTVKRLKVIQ